MNDGREDVRRAAEDLAERLPDALTPLARLAYNYSWSWLPGGPEYQGKRIALKAMLVEVLRGYLDRAVEDRKIAPQDTETAAYVWIGAISEVALRWLNTGKPEPLEEVLAPLSRLLLRSVGFSATPVASR